MEKSKRARDLLGLPSDNEEAEEATGLTRILDEVQSEWVLWVIITLVWPVALFGVRAGNIFVSLFVALGLGGSFIGGWGLYIFIGLVAGVVVVASRFSGADLASQPIFVKLMLKSVTLAVMFYVFFPVDSLIAESQIREEARSIVEVDVMPSGDDEIIEILVNGDSYTSSREVFSSPSSFMKFANEYKPVAVKTLEVAGGGFGLPFLKSTPGTFRFVFDEGDPFEAKFDYFLADYSLVVTIKVSLRYDNQITIGGTGTYLGTNDYRSDIQDGTNVRVLYSSDSASWNEIGSFSTTEGGGSTNLSNPGPGKLKLVIDPLGDLPEGSSEVVAVPSD
jgi:hypothetical protein